MKYYRKQPVEAIQWRGDNQKGVSEFIERVSCGFCTQNDEDGKLTVGYLDSKQNSHIVKMPKFGWVVADGKTLQFFKDETFKKTFESVVDRLTDYLAGRTHRSIIDKDERAFEGFNDPFRGFHGVFKEKIQDEVNKKASENEGLKEILDKYFEDKAHSKWLVDYFRAPAIHVRRDFEDTINKEARASILRNRAQCLSDFLRRDNISRKDVGFDTFDSVLDEMKELHAKKNKDYKGSFHDLFKEYGMPYALGHLEEKLNRVKAITENGGNAVKNDHIEDSVIDLACYAVMLYVELKNKENGTDKD